MLRIGRIAYANCTPIFHALTHLSGAKAFQFTEGSPAVLNALLAEGLLDICPSSSFAYALHPDRYLILPDLSISSIGPVQSVLLFSRCPIEELDGKDVLLSSESATSVNLLKILLQQRYGCACRYAATGESLKALNRAPALLLIGDAALKSSKMASGLHVYDLGQLWYDWTGLPFVFALWFVHRKTAETRSYEVFQILQLLHRAKQQSLANLPTIAAVSPEARWMGFDNLVSYWQIISYDLSHSHLEGLRSFFTFSASQGLSSGVPDLHFFGKVQ